MSDRALYAGVELGGTKCIALLASGPEEVVARETVATTTPEDTLGALERILSGWRAHDPQALGIASFGPLDLASGQIAATPKPKWSGAPVRERLQSALGLPTVLDTDVNGAALAEMQWGAGRGFDDFAYITVGTGVGVGLIVNGAPTRGFAHCELGHIRVPRLPGDDFPGSCPFHGDCVEGLSAGPSLEARGARVGALAQDDPIWDSVAWALAQLCHAIVCAAAPEAIAIGGGVVDKQRHLLGRIDGMLAESLNGYMQLPASPYVRAPALGRDAGPLGAIALAMTARP
jgi:fructokinase